MEQIKAGQQLMGITVRVPLFLVCEELKKRGDARGAEVLKAFTEIPPSDGKVLHLRRDLGKSFSPEQGGHNLVVFRNLANAIAPSPALATLVEARNRFHHPPYDATAFLAALDEHIPPIVASLRAHLSGVRFCVPIQGAVTDGRLMITAREICCSEPFFTSFNLQTTAPFESFPANKLVAFAVGSPATVTFDEFLTCKPILNTSLDFGILERFGAGEPKYEFVRST